MLTSNVFQITLGEEERFMVKHPQRRKTHKVKMIEVHQDGFWLFVVPSRMRDRVGLHELIEYGFRKVDEVPMPLSIAQEVQRCLDTLKAEPKAA